MLGGEHGPFRDAALLGSAAGLIVAGKTEDLEQGVAMAADSVDSARAMKALEGLIAITNEQVPA